jgi:acetyl esterase/lipase
MKGLLSMDFSKNRDTLTQVVEARASIRPVSQHRKPDGTMDVEGNLKLWNAVIGRFDRTLLWEGGAPGYDGRDPLQPPPSIVFVPAPQADKPRGTVVVAHGGGFRTRTGCEGIHVGDSFNRAGFAVAILTYRLEPYSRRDAMADMHRAVRLLRCRAGEWGISDKVAVMGFSAGGMLSGNCATHFDSGDKNAKDPVERFSSRPDAAVVAYGAFSSVAFPGGFMHNPFEDRERAEKLYLATEKNITRETPPFFIWQTNSDDPRLSMNLARELTEAGVPFELHCFPQGVHGMALADGNNDLDMRVPHVARWAELCAEWLESLGF